VAGATTALFGSPSQRGQGEAALLTAGVPGAGKSRAIDQLGVVGEGWRRLDADVVKDYLIEDLVAARRHEDLLGEPLADGYPVMPAELATLVHEESVVFLAQLRGHCLSRGENVVIEGTLSWPPAAEPLRGELVRDSGHGKLPGDGHLAAHHLTGQLGGGG